MKKLIFLLLLISIGINAQNVDINILISINSPQTLQADGFFRFISNSEPYVILGVPVTMVTVSLMNNDDKLLHSAGDVAISSVLNFGVTYILKHAISRERPFRKYPGIVFNKTLKPTNDPSFPSGHTSSAFNLASSLSLEYSKWYIIVPSFAYASTVTYSRMYLGVHCPTDVLAGVSLGVGTAYLIYRVDKKLIK